MNFCGALGCRSEVEAVRRLVGSCRRIVPALRGEIGDE